MACLCHSLPPYSAIIEFIYLHSFIICLYYQNTRFKRDHFVLFITITLGLMGTQSIIVDWKSILLHLPIDFFPPAFWSFSFSISPKLMNAVQPCLKKQNFILIESYMQAL